MHRLVLVNFAFAAEIQVLQLEPVFTAIGDDWIRISPASWILWTNKPAGHIYILLRPHLSRDDEILISTLEGEYFASFSPWIWDWIASKGANQRLVIGPQAVQIAGLPAPKPNQDR